MEIEHFLNMGKNSTELTFFHNQDTILAFASTTKDVVISLTQFEILRLVSRVLCSFSITGLVFVQIVFWFFRSIRTFALELVALLCLSNILFNVSVYFPISTGDNAETYQNGNLSVSCTIQAFINIMFDLSSMIWTTIIGFTAYISVANQEHLERNKMKYRIGFILLAYLLPLAYSLIVLLTKTYGPAGSFCWIATNMDTTETSVLTIIYYSFTWLIILLNCLFVIKVILLLKRELQNEKELIEKYISKLRLYPIVLIISYIPATINRIYNLTTGKDDFTLMLIQVIFDSLTGLMFALVYGLNSSVKKAIKDCFSALCCKKSPRRDSNTTTIIDTSTHNRLSKALSFIDDSVVETE